MPPDWLTCTYQCGKYQVKLHDVMGRSGRDCDKSQHLKRAEKEAEKLHAQRQKP